MLYIRGTAETDSTNKTRSRNKYILTTKEKKKTHTTNNICTKRHQSYVIYIHACRILVHANVPGSN